MAESTSTGSTNSSEAARPRVQSVARAADILFAVAASPDGLAPRDVSDLTGLSRQTVYHLVHTLLETRLLRRRHDNRLVVGLGAGSLAAAFERQIGLSEQLRPYVTALAERTGELAYASAWLGEEIAVVSVARGSSVVQAREVVVGNSQDAYARASGKLLLALAPDTERDRYLDTHRLTRRTAHTNTSRPALEQELGAISEQGYAIDNEEFAEGLCCVAVPLGGTPYVLGVSVPAERYRSNSEQYLVNALAVAADHLD